MASYTKTYNLLSEAYEELSSVDVEELELEKVEAHLSAEAALEDLIDFVFALGNDSERTG